MPLRIAISVAVCLAAVEWLGATPTQNVPAPAPVAAFRLAVTAGGYIYISGIKADDGATDIAAQTKSVFTQLKTILDANGSSMGQLCSVQVALKSASDFAAMNTAYAEVFGAAPPTRTTFVAWLRGSSLIEISAIALPVGAYREAMQPVGWAKNPRPYSYIIKTDDLVFFSGLTARRGVDDSVVKGSAKVQTDTVLDNAGTLLETAGLTYDDVVSARVFITSPYDFQDMNEVYGRYFTKDAPARGTAVVELMSLDASVEITMIASRKDKSVIGGQAANGLPVSLAVQAGPRVWLSAVIGDTDKHPKDVVAQTKDVLEHFRTTLSLADLTLSDIVDAVVYMPDTFELPKVDELFKSLFPKDAPARTVTSTRLVVEPAMIELMATAVKK